MDTQKHKCKSSPTARAAAKVKLECVRTRLKEIESEQTNQRTWRNTLLVAARFVVDVNGDPPSIQQLRLAVEEAERQIALSEEWVELKKRRERLGGESTYHQWVAGRGCGIGFIVRGEGDTKAEAIANADSGQSG